MNIRVFDLRNDDKIRARCLLIDMPIVEYTKLIEENIGDLDIQRGKILSRKREVYKRLIEDLKDGAIMPPISLILRENSSAHKKIKDSTGIEDIEKQLNEKIEKGDLAILDGIQRTYCILNVIDELEGLSEKETFLNQRIRAELWYNMTYTAILYKMLVLNTGQVKMSMRHQIEILNIPLKEKISKIALEKEITPKFSTYRRPQPTEDIYGYKLSDIVEAFTSFITTDPIVDKTSEVVNELERMEFVKTHSKPEMLSKEEEIQEFTDVLINLDKGLWGKYRQPIQTEVGSGETEPWTSRKEIMTSAPILSGIFAAFGYALKNDKDGYNSRKGKFFQILQGAESDPLKLKIMSKLLQDEKKRSTKFGETTRNFFFNALREFFKGEDNLERLWTRSAT